jgi:alginate O-acetyltransferase complex protein AlgJ
VDTSTTYLRNKPPSVSDQSTVGVKEQVAPSDWATIAIFIGMVYGLFLCTILNMVTVTNKVSVQEKRNLRSMPHLRLTSASLKAFSAGFEGFLNDRFALRTELVRGASFIKYAFGVSNSEEVLIGKNDWLYYQDSCDEHTLRHWPLFQESEVNEWARALEARRIWLNQRGIKFLFVIAPSKFSVYPEFVPGQYTRLVESSRRQQLTQALSKRTKVKFLDLLDTMIKARKRGQVYYKTDTHWNVLGGAIAASRIIEAIRPWLPKIKRIDIDSFRVEQHLFENGDLASLLGLHGVLREVETLLAIHPNWHFSDNPKPDTGDRRDDFPFALEVDDPKLPRAFFVRDSFMAMPKLFLGDCFRRAYFSPTQVFPAETILREKPEVVVEELVERRLVGEMLTNPPEVDAVMTWQRFARKPTK